MNPTVASTQVKSDQERWFADTYALWSEYAGGSWRLTGGYDKSRETMRVLSEMLERDWGIKTPQDGIREVNVLIDESSHHNPDFDAWDYCRAMQLLGVFYVVDFLTHDQMVGYCRQVGKIMQQHYHSWGELCEAYLRGHERWLRQVFSNPADAKKIARERRAIYERLCKMQDGPYRLPWDLTLEPGSSSGSGGYFQQWLRQEEGWMSAHRKKMQRQMLLIIAPLTILLLVAITAGTSALEGGSHERILTGAITGVVVGAVLSVILSIAVSSGLRRGRLSQAISDAVKQLGLDELRKERLGLEMLNAISNPGMCLDFQMKGPGSRATPARLLVSNSFFYLVGSHPLAILIDRAELDYFDVDQEKKTITTRSSKRTTTRLVTLYTILFYYCSSRERRLEGGRTADAGMGFWDASIRDRAFEMMGGRRE